MNCDQSLRRAAFPALLMLCALVATIVGYSVGRTGVSRSASPLSTPPEALDLGEIWRQADFRCELPIHNTSSHPVEIVDFRASCNCTSIEPRTAVIGPHATVTFTVTIDLTLIDAARHELQPAHFSVDVLPLLKAGIPGSPMQLRAKVKTAITAVPRRLEYATPLIRGQAMPALQVALRALPSVAQVEARCDPRYGTVVVDGNGENRDWTATFTPSEAAPLGAFTSKVEVIATMDDGKRLPPIEVPILGQIAGPVRVEPEVLALGAVSIDESVTNTVQLVDFRGRPLVVESIDSPKGISVSPSANETGARFEVETVALKLGACSQTIVFHVRTIEAQTAAPVSLTIAYMGMLPDTSKSPPKTP